MKINKKVIKALIGAGAIIISALVGDKYGEAIRIVGDAVVETTAPSITSGYDSQPEQVLTPCDSE